MNIEFAESAIGDLEDIRTYYQDQQMPQVGEIFIVEIIRHIETLSVNPEIGRQVPEFGVPSIRELIHAPFRLVYVVNATSIQIIRVWRSERLMRLP